MQSPNLLLLLMNQRQFGTYSQKLLNRLLIFRLNEEFFCWNGIPVLLNGIYIRSTRENVKWGKYGKYFVLPSLHSQTRGNSNLPHRPLEASPVLSFMILCFEISPSGSCSLSSHYKYLLFVKDCASYWGYKECVNCVRGSYGLDLLYNCKHCVSGKIVIIEPDCWNLVICLYAPFEWQLSLVCSNNILYETCYTLSWNFVIVDFIYGMISRIASCQLNLNSLEPSILSDLSL